MKHFTVIYLFLAFSYLAETLSQQYVLDAVALKKKHFYNVFTTSVLQPRINIAVITLYF